jgi:hypothetical protein
MKVTKMEDIKLFKALTDAEEKEAIAKKEMDKATAIYRDAQNNVKLAWDDIAAYMQETGETEIILQGAMTDFKICRTPITTTLDIIDVDAVPEEFVRVKKEPDKTAINKAYKDCELLPNWLTQKKGGGNLTWKTIKKS